MSELDEMFSGTSRVPLDQSDWDAGVSPNGQVRITRGSVTVGLTTALSEKIRSGFQKLPARGLAIANGWLVEEAGTHTCGAGGAESGYLHEPGCGWIPLVNLVELDGWPGGES